MNYARADIAENYPSDKDLEPGDVVCLDQDEDRVIQSKKPNDPMVFGVVSTELGFLLNSKLEATEVKIPNCSILCFNIYIIFNKCDCFFRKLLL